MAEKKKILSVAKTDFLGRTRKIALRRAGYSVASVKDFNEIEALSKSETFDVAVVGYAFEPQVKRAIAEILRKYFPNTPIVELTTRDADIPESIPSNPQPAELQATIQAVLRNQRTKKARSSN